MSKEMEDDGFSLFLSRLSSLVEALDSPPITNVPPVTQSHLSRSAAQITHQCTSLTLILQQEKAEDKMFFPLDGVLLELFSVYRGLTTEKSGPTLVKIVRYRVMKLLGSIEALLIEYQREQLEGKRPFSVPTHLTGLVWRDCELFEKSPLTNVKAVSFELYQISEMVKDAYEELQEMLDIDSQQDFSDSEEDDVIMVFKGEKLSLEETKLVTPISMLLKTGFNIIEKVGKAIDLLDPNTPYTLIENFVVISHDISKNTDDLTSLVEHPVDYRLLSTSLKGLETSVINLVATVKVDKNLGVDERMLKMLGVVEKIYSSQMAILSELIVK